MATNPDAVESSLVLDPSAESARTARQFVRAALARLGRSELAESAEIGVAELTANVALHARTPFTVSVSATMSGGVRICVADSSPVLPRTTQRGQLAGTGRGLRLVSAAGSWGIEQAPEGAGKTIWFEPHAQLDASAFALLTDPVAPTA